MSKKAKADKESSAGKSPPTSKACRHWLEEIGRASGRACLVPLPTTRELGERFRLSHGTVARILQDMRDRELLWQHLESGRFYPAQAAKVLGRPKPLAVVLRHMQSWSTLCRDVMIGFTEECALQEIPILLLHCGGLLHEDNPGSGSAVVATTSVQKGLLAEIHLRYGDLVDGYFLDELWKDEAIASSIPKATRVSTFYRKTSLPHVSSATVDYPKDAAHHPRRSRAIRRPDGIHRGNSLPQTWFR